MVNTVIYCDGSCEPINPGGTAAFGWVAYKNSKRIGQNLGIVCKGKGATNNVAEYSAIIDAMKHFSVIGNFESITIRSDSQLVIRQLEGKYRVGSPLLLPLYETVKELEEDFSSVTYEWIPRESNQVADYLSKKACGL